MVRKWSVFVATLVLSTAPTAATIEWEVVNRFPLFRHAGDFDRVAAHWAKDGTVASTMADPRFTDSLRELLPIAGTAWHPESGTYSRDVLFRASHLIRATAVGATGMCRWKVDEAAQGALTPCSESVSLSVPARRAFRISAEEVNSGRISADQAPTGIREELIVALGDSFASGEGNPDHPTKFKAGAAPASDWFLRKDASRFIEADARWWDETCHRSLLSWPALAALRLAVQDKKAVVQFASFACSGAEVFDGILRAQLDPPGSGPGVQERGGLRSFSRDGGAGYHWQSAGERDTGQYAPGEPHKTRVRLSQLHALALLLCEDSKQVKARTVDTGTPTFGVREAQNFFGNVDLYSCASERRTPDRVVVSIGGNDTGFAGIVKYMLVAETTRKDTLSALGVRQLGLWLFRKELAVITPQAAAAGVKTLPALYDVAAAALDGLGVPRARTTLLVYPNPTGSVVDAERCQMRTRDGNRPMQIQIDKRVGNPNFLLGINKQRFATLERDYIGPLRQAQEQSIRRLGWRSVDANDTLKREDGASLGYCGLSPACSAQACSNGERVRFWRRPSYSDEPPFAALSDYRAYDQTRTRGFRYAVDALLAGAARNKKGEIRQDWLTLSAHPTGEVHARVADRVAAP